MNCNNTHCMWNAFDSCCHESEEAFDKATPNMLDCPSSLRNDIMSGLYTLVDECESLLRKRNLRELLEIRSFIEKQREAK